MRVYVARNILRVKNFEDKFVLYSTELILFELRTFMVGACGEIFILGTQMPVLLSVCWMT